MKKLILAAALTLLCTGSALAADGFSFGITLGVPVAPVYTGWYRSYPVVREYRPVYVRDYDYDYGYRHRRDLDRDCRTMREAYYDRGRFVAPRGRTVCDTHRDDWRPRHDDRDDWRYDDDDRRDNRR